MLDPVQFTEIVVCALKLATPCSVITAILSSGPSCTEFDAPKFVNPQRTEFVGFRRSEVVFVTVAVNMIQYWPAGTVSAATCKGMMRIEALGAVTE